MVSKDKYYELKTQGFCVKCGKERGESISDVRCQECHTRFLDSKKVKREERVVEGLCIQCGEVPLLGNSKYCNDCRAKNTEYKKNLTAKPLSVYKESNEHCRICDSPIDTLGIVCQKCLEQVQFSKADAMTRYGMKCGQCFKDDPEILTFASSDISKPMKYTGPELYRHICFSSTLSKDYVVSCHECYWKINMVYINNLRSFLLDDSVEIDDISESDIIDGLADPADDSTNDSTNEDDDDIVE